LLGIGFFCWGKYNLCISSKYKNYMNLENPGLSSDEQYKKNFTEEQRAKHLPLDEAQDEANMMKGILYKGKGEKPNETGIYREYKIGKGMENKEFTKEEYQEALDFIDKLKEKFKDESEATENLYKLGRGFHTLGRIVGYPIAELSLTYEEMRRSLAGLVHGLDSYGSPYAKHDMEPNESIAYTWLHELDSKLERRLMDLKQAEEISQKYESSITK